MTIRKTLLALTTILSVFIFYFTASNLWEAWESKNTYVYSKAKSLTIESLISAAGDLALERGITNTALNASAPASPAVLERIMKHRSQANESLDTALKEVRGTNFVEKEMLLEAVDAAYKSVKALRAEADQALRLSISQRDANLKNIWVPTMTKLVETSQELRLVLGVSIGLDDPVLGKESQLQHAAWLMSEYAGRERAIVGGLIASGAPIDTASLQKLARFRGHVETGWSMLKDYSYFSGAGIKNAVKEMETVYWGSFENLRSSVYRSGSLGFYPVDSATWINESTKAINTILAVQDQTVIESHAVVAEQIAIAERQLMFNAALFLVNVLLMLYTFRVIILRVIRPIRLMTQRMESLATGDLSVKIPGLDRKDEIGEMAQSVLIFKQNAEEKIQLEAEAKRAEEKSIADQKAAMNTLADTFEQNVKGVVNMVSSAATELSMTAQDVTERVDRSAHMAQDATGAAADTTANVQSVAAAAEELTASVREISSQVQRSNELVNASVQRTEAADVHAQALLAASQQVREVIQLIADISGQINLLSLNATIESARAGEAGKGFAVVASEVKNLANQTDQSIQTIQKVIEGMDAASADIVSSLSDIKQSIEEISHGSGGIASAVEEQSATTDEIASNMQTASSSTQMIGENLKQVAETSAGASQASREILEASQELSQQAATLDTQVDEFLATIRES